MFKKETMQRQFRDAHRLLVICLGNILRSPFAAAYLRGKLADRVEIREGGYLPKTDRPTPELAVQVAASLGVDLAEHRSRAFSNDDLDWADVILCFDEDNYDHLCERLSGKADKVWPLGTVFDGKSPWIADPYGADAAGFRRTYETIRNCCDELIEELRS